ncbi:hypothetical protein [Chromobacterium amazonense]|nr:hypothetical protein [Chromobacterium amazonense]
MKKILVTVLLALPPCAAQAAAGVLTYSQALGVSIGGMSMAGDAISVSA